MEERSSYSRTFPTTSSYTLHPPIPPLYYFTLHTPKGLMSSAGVFDNGYQNHNKSTTPLIRLIQQQPRAGSLYNELADIQMPRPIKSTKLTVNTSTVDVLVSNSDGIGGTRDWSGCALLHNQMPTHAFLKLSGSRLPSAETNLRDSKPVVPKMMERKLCLQFSYIC